MAAGLPFLPTVRRRNRGNVSGANKSETIPDEFCAVRVKSIAKRLGEHLGGKWTYDRHSSWWCDDGKRHVARCSPGTDDRDEQLGPPMYYLYGGETPQRVIFGSKGISLA